MLHENLILLLLLSTGIEITLGNPWEAFMIPSIGGSRGEYKGIGGFDLIPDENQQIPASSSGDTMFMSEIPSTYMRNPGIRFPEMSTGNRFSYPQFPDRSNYNPYSSPQSGFYRDNLQASYRHRLSG